MQDYTFGMSWTKRVSYALITIFFSVLIGVVIAECMSRLFIAQDAQWDRRYMLFQDKSGGEVFETFSNFFLYVPNRTVRAVTFYDTDSGWTREYDYIFKTNNLGFVQAANIDRTKEAILLLGDSFAEGHGASPWFEEFTSQFKWAKYQPLNGGLLGTGFEQWFLVRNHLLSRNIVPSKLVIIFISDDFVRHPWNFERRVLECINNYKICNGTENFYGMPPDDDIIGFLEKLRKSRSFLHIILGNHFTYKQKLLWIFSGLSRFYPLVEGRYQSPFESRNALVIEKFISDYGKDVIFVHLPQKSELASGMSQQGTYARDVITKSGGQLLDGFEHCALTRDDFHVNDGHPNGKGYRKIASCVLDAVSRIM